MREVASFMISTKIDYSIYDKLLDYSLLNLIYGFNMNVLMDNSNPFVTCFRITTKLSKFWLHFACFFFFNYIR